MKAAVFSLETAALSASRSTAPSFDFSSTTSKPAIAAEAGFVPCALSGTTTSWRWLSPLDAW